LFSNPENRDLFEVRPEYYLAKLKEIERTK
jgi:YHS domain-containing protein